MSKRKGFATERLTQLLSKPFNSVLQTGRDSKAESAPDQVPLMTRTNQHPEQGLGTQI